MNGLSSFGGALTTVAVVGFCQDRFGSLEGYIAHLREPGVWTQMPLIAYIVLGLGGVALSIAGGSAR